MSKFKRKKLNSGSVLVRPLKLWQDNSAQEDVRLELLPLIDVIFCILTFFILAAVSFSRQQAITLNLPKAQTGQPVIQENLIVSLDDFGQVFVEKQLVPEDQLLQIIKNFYLINPQGLVVLHASKQAQYIDVLDMLDLLRSLGGDRVALATLPGDAENSPNYPIIPR